MKNPFHNLLTDTLCVLTMNLGSYWYDPDCDGTVHHYDWFGFHASFVDYDNHFYGHGLSRHYPAPRFYGADEMNDVSQNLNKIILDIKRYNRRVRKFLKFMYLAREVKDKKLLFQLSWKYSKNA